MRYLGIDFGLKKIGLAISEGVLPHPYKVIRVKNPNNSLNEIKEIIQKEKIDKIIVGISEGEMAEKSKKFAAFLKSNTAIDTETIDETLSSQNAQNLLYSAKKQRKKRKESEDAASASLILENYLSSHDK